MKPSLRFHHLRAFGRSAAHGLAAITGQSDVETTAIERGSAFHSVVLETGRVLAYPGKVRRGKEWDAFEAEHIGSEILTTTEYDKVMRMAESVRNHPTAMDLLTGVRETMLEWRLYDQQCRATPDVRNESRVVELKSCACAEPLRFTGQALRMAYHAQLAWYMDAVVASKAGSPKDAYIVAVESAPPYPVTVLRLTDRAIEAGRGLYHLWLERFFGSERSGEWPGYVQSVVDLDVPDEVELDFGEAA